MLCNNKNQLQFADYYYLLKSNISITKLVRKQSECMHSNLNIKKKKRKDKKNIIFVCAYVVHKSIRFRNAHSKGLFFVISA